MAMNDVRRLTRFVDLMGYKLMVNSHKSDWRNDTFHQLLDRLREETTELATAIGRNHRNRSRDEIMAEAADVANFAMMIADLAYETLTPDETEE